MNNNYDNSIWQIQFCMYPYLSRECKYNMTLDLENKLLVTRKTLRSKRIVYEKIYEIADNELKALHNLVDLEKIKSFEAKEFEELKDLELGYRDGWRLEYSYFTNGRPPRIDGILGAIYKDNPMEDIVKWIKDTFPDATSVM